MDYHLLILRKCVKNKTKQNKIKTDYIIVMKNTKKNQRKQSSQRKTVKRRGKIYKKGGASVTDSKPTALRVSEVPLKPAVTEVPKEVDPSKADLETRSLEELAKIKEERARANNEMVEDASTVAKGVVANTLETAGDLVGVDIDNPEAVHKKLEDIKETLSDPKNTEEIKEIVAEAAKKGAVVVEAASPLIDPLAEKALDVGSKTAEKMADTGTTILSNFVKEIPGVGLVYSLLQDASKVGEAGSAVINATAELTTDTADSAVVFKKNLEELQKEGADTENRAAESVKQFENPIPTVPVPTVPVPTVPVPTVPVSKVPVPTVPVSKVPVPSVTETAKKGGKKSTKKKNFKKKNTKRVRFAL